MGFVPISGKDCRRSRTRHEAGGRTNVEERAVQQGHEPVEARRWKSGTLAGFTYVRFAGYAQ